MRGMLLAMAGIVAWCAIAAMLAPIVGRFCAMGSEPDPVRERLREVRADRLEDEETPLYV